MSDARNEEPITILRKSVRSLHQATYHNSVETTMVMMMSHRRLLATQVKLAIGATTRRKLSSMRHRHVLQLLPPQRNDIACYRCLSSSSTSAEEQSSSSSTQAHLQETLGIDPELHTGILKALESIHGKGKVRVEHLQAFGKDGMLALAESVKLEQDKLRKQQGDARRPSYPLIINIPHHSTKFQLEWKMGDSLLDVAKQNEDMLGEYMEGTCGGNMSCCTCHVYLDEPYWSELLNPPEESELDMLDLAYEPKETASRLGCQVRLTPSMVQQLKAGDAPFDVTIPAGVNNVWN